MIEQCKAQIAGVRYDICQVSWLWGRQNKFRRMRLVEREGNQESTSHFIRSLDKI